MTHSLDKNESARQPQQVLSLVDSISIIVGIIIGSAIYEISPLVASSAGGWAVGWTSWWASHGGPPASEGLLTAASGAAIVGVWILGGLVALVGAMCYAELATAYPRAGGTYVFLSEALGRSVGFAFAWCEFWIVRPGNVGAVAFVLARYGTQLLPESIRSTPYLSVYLAAGATLALSLLNLLGLKAGTRTQNLLSGCKLAGLAAIVLTALTLSPQPTPAPTSNASGNLSLALILIMFAYGGWADMSFVAAEVRDPKRNIFRSLFAGTMAVVVIYVAINLAFLYGLGLRGLAKSNAVAAEVLALRFGAFGSHAISLLVVISCLGTINGMLFTGVRVFYALGTQHPTFRWLGTWNEQTGVPVRSLLLQTLVTIGLIMGFGLAPNGFERLVVFTGPFYWGFIGLVGIALIMLRPHATREDGMYRVPLYPLTPLIFAASSGAMIYAAIAYVIEKRSEPGWALGASWAVLVAAVGLVVGIVDWRTRMRQGRA